MQEDGTREKSVIRGQWLQRIESNITRFGRHIYSVAGGASPRFLYTIGLQEKVGFELVLAGMTTLPQSEAAELLNSMARELEMGVDPDSLGMDFKDFGHFTLGKVDSSWSQRMLLGALDYYRLKEIEARQVVPQQERATIDLPTMSSLFGPSSNPTWRWLEDDWPYSVSSKSLAGTNLDALKGYAISEISRWEVDEWEMYSGPAPDVPENEMFMVPLSILLGFDSTLEPALSLDIGAGLFREHDDDGVAGPWQKWESREKL